MIVWEGFNALMDWMNAHGSNDYASLTIIMVVGAIVWNQLLEPLCARVIDAVKEAVSDWKTGRQLRKSKEAAR